MTEVAGPACREPRGGRILWLHAAGAFCFGTGLAVQVVLPFLARQRFGATNWQTTVLTAAVPVTQFFSIFWNHLYARLDRRPYLAIVAVLSCVPVGLLGRAENIWEVMGLFALAALGGASGTAAMSPLIADLLRSCYGADVRGRALGIISTAQFGAAMCAGQIMGTWLDRDADAYRRFFPLLALLMAAGLGLFALVCRTPAMAGRRPEAPPRGSWWAPIRHMAEILRSDRRFAGYEAAFMAYGVGWMICTALVPALATDRLRLNYSQFAQATIVAYQVTNIVMQAAMGRLADRVGPMHLAAGSFLWLTMFPVGLIFAGSGWTLGALNVWYAMGMVGVQLTWTLGPVALAPDAGRAAQYLAIHGTMVGIRGVVAQGLGMALYSLTGDFTIPLLLAAGGFLWASWRMRRLAMAEKC
jgi:MFS family permease